MQGRLVRVSRRSFLAAAPVAALLVAAFLNSAAARAETRPADSFAAIQRQVTTLQGKLIQATVGIQVGQSRGSGVIISKDGYVLTAAHVIGGTNKTCNGVLPDGRAFKGKTLGLNHPVDYGLVKIEGMNDLPTAPIGDSNTLRMGQWVIATGHPLGHRIGRPPVLRLGRVLGYSDRGEGRPPTKVVSDAPLISGDSGGPLFDLTGRVVGVNVMIAGGRRDGISMHTLVNLPKAVMDQLKKGETLRAPTPPPAAFLEPWRQAKSQLAAGDLSACLKSSASCQAADPTDAGVHVLMARAHARNNNPAQAVACLEQAVARGFNDGEELRGERDFAGLAGNARFKELTDRLDLFSKVPGERKGDRALVAAASRLAPDMGRGVVRVLADGKEVAMGLVMSATGDVLTKASELREGELRCMLSDGRIVPAALVGRDEKWDVALLKASASNLPVVELSESYGVGQWTFTPDPNGNVLAAGVIGVAEMPVRTSGISNRPENSAFMGVLLTPVESEALQGLDVKGAARLDVREDFPAAKAGLQTGDLVYQVDNESVIDPDELSGYLATKKPGDKIVVKVVRRREKLSFTVTLGGRPPDAVGGPSMPAMLSGEISTRQGPFPRVLHHDAILRPTAMGGPLLNDSGKCVGMNIARADRTSTYALPVRDIREVYVELKKQAVNHQGSVQS